MVSKKTIMKIGIGVAFVAIILAIVLAVTVSGKDSDLENNEKEARCYIEKLDEETAKRRNEQSIAEWAYASNITDENEARRLNVSLINARLTKSAWEETVTYKWQDFQDYDLKRKFKKYSILGSAALNDDDLEKLKKAIAEMESNYATSKICDYKNATKCDLSLEPDITEIFAESHDPEELKHAWVEWHAKAGSRVKKQFKNYVELSNKAAKLNNFSDNAESWLSEYEQDDFEDEMAKLWLQIKPLYLQIHAYVRRRLNEKYGDEIVNKRGPIPAHLLGNVWGQSWVNLDSFTRPYPEKPQMDTTANMVKQNYTALKMFKIADEFFQSLNLTAMPPKFWKNSIIEKPKDGRELICHASAWDFFDGEDFRIKMCTVINQESFETVHHEMGHIQYYLQYKDQPSIYREGANPDSKHFTTVHHEMGHIQYFLQYKNQPAIYRDGANPGFHEAIGDVMALSVSTPKHLRKIGLLDDGPNDYQSEINHLFNKGIEKIVFLPFAYLLDVYRYGIFRGSTPPEDYNCHFWKLREEIQGLEPPVNRTEEDFDAAAKYHVSADVEYARYYVSFIIQFQFHRALCEKAGEYVAGDENKKLTDCDIYRSVDAGNALAKVLQMGSSRPWQDAMEILTGQRRMDAAGILEYFKPLELWLKEENARTNEFIGWEPSTKTYCTASQKAKIEESKKPKTDSLTRSSPPHGSGHGRSHARGPWHNFGGRFLSPFKYDLRSYLISV